MFLDLSPNRNSTNATINSLSAPNKWTFFPVFSVVILASAFLTNGTVLRLFLNNPTLCTPFNLYIINLLAANLLNMVTQVPVYLVNSLAGYWWTGRASCNLYLYGFIFQAGMSNAHALITINRLWAVLWPVNYRRCHNHRTALAVCGGMWLYVHVIKLAWLIPDALHYRLPEEKFGCTLNRAAQPTWAVVHQFVGYNGPAFLMVISYPVICFQQYQRLWRKSSNQTAPRSATGFPVKRIETGQMCRSKVKNRMKGTQGFWILTLVTGMVLLVWTPTLVYYTVILFRTVNWPVLQRTATVLWFLEAFLDPVLFTLALRDLRNEVTKLWHKQLK